MPIEKMYAIKTCYVEFQSYICLSFYTPVQGNNLQEELQNTSTLSRLHCLPSVSCLSRWRNEYHTVLKNTTVIGDVVRKSNVGRGLLTILIVDGGSEDRNVLIVPFELKGDVL